MDGHRLESQNMEESNDSIELVKEISILHLAHEEGVEPEMKT
jgi:hypothetical protein